MWYEACVERGALPPFSGGHVRPGTLILLLAAALALASGPASARRGADTLDVDAPGTLEFAPACPRPSGSARPSGSGC